MDDVDAINLALLVFRCGIGAVMLAHGVNHVIGGGKIDGTARWFGSMGMRRPMLQAWLASGAEIVSGVLLVIGLLTPAAAACVVGVMAVAWIINHRGNGFFIFRPGEGWEYVATLAVASTVVGIAGPGRISVDNALGLLDLVDGWTGFVVVLLGVAAAAGQLATFWREPKKITS